MGPPAHPRRIACLTGGRATPIHLRDADSSDDFTRRLVRLGAGHTIPPAAARDEYGRRMDVRARPAWPDQVRAYQRGVLAKR